MNIFWIIAIGLLSGIIGMVAIPLSLFIDKVEDGATCMTCEKRNNCFAKKTLFWGKSDWLSEFMLVSYYKVRKKCAYAAGSDKKIYILYVFLNIVLTGILFLSNGMNITGILYGITGAALLSLSIVDWNTRYIPLEMSGVIFICGLIRIFVDISNCWEYVIGLFTVSGFLFLINKISVPILKKRYTGKDMEIDSAIGDGDIKLMAATGLLLGWKLNFLALGIGCVAGSAIHMVLMAVKKEDGQLSFGPYLSLGVYITMLCGTQLVSWYLSRMGIRPV